MLDSFVDRNPLNALRVWQGDPRGRCAVRFAVPRTASPTPWKIPAPISLCIHYLFCAKNIERIGDHATNIAEAVHYMVEGRAIVGERPKGDTSSFVIETLGSPARICLSARRDRRYSAAPARGLHPPVAEPGRSAALTVH